MGIPAVRGGMPWQTRGGDCLFGAARLSRWRTALAGAGKARAGAPILSILFLVDALGRTEFPPRGGGAPLDPAKPDPSSRAAESSRGYAAVKFFAGARRRARQAPAH